MEYPLDIESEIEWIEREGCCGTSSEPYLALTDDGRIVIATFDIEQKLEDWEMQDYCIETNHPDYTAMWMEFEDPSVISGEVDFGCATSVKVVKWIAVDWDKLINPTASQAKEQMMTNELHPQGTSRVKDVLQIIKISRTTLWRWVKNGTFPKPARLSSHCTLWRNADIIQWLNEQLPTQEANNERK